MTDSPLLPETPPVERQVAFDMIRRGLPALPVVVVAAALLRGRHGAESAAFAIGLVLVNFVVAATLLAWAARSLNLLMAATLGGFVVRMGAVVAAIAAVRHRSWVDLPTLGITIVIAHLGLLVWETRFVSASLAFPSLKPKWSAGPTDAGA